MPLLLLSLSLIRPPALEGADATVTELTGVEKGQSVKKRKRLMLNTARATQLCPTDLPVPHTM